MIRGEDDYYKFMSLAVQDLINVIDKDLLYKFIIAHLLELLSFEDTQVLLDYLYSKDRELTDLEISMKAYYDANILRDKNITGILLNNKGTQQLLRLRENKWHMGESEDYEDLSNKIRQLIIPEDRLFNIIGYISDFKKNYNIFKIKLLNKKRNKGARCDQAGKGESIKILNDILGTEKYTTENTKGIHQKMFCIYQEMYLRYYNNIGKDGKVWYLNPIQAILSPIRD